MKFVCKITAIFVAVLLAFSGLSISALALDSELVTEENLYVYIPKNTVGSIAFYPTLGFLEDNCDYFDWDSVLSYEIDSETNQKYDIYKLFTPQELCSFRATDLSGNSLGGGVIPVIREESPVTAYLRLTKSYITNKFEEEKATAEDFSVTLENQYGAVTMGDAYIDEKGYACYPALLYANGNALLYYATFTPSEAYAQLHQVKETRLNHNAVFKGDRIQSFKTELPKAIPFTIVAPSDTEVTMYEQILNFNTVKIPTQSITDNGDGTSNYLFPYAGTSYRVSREGMRTQAGYIPQDIAEDEASLEVFFPESLVDEQIDVGIGRKESGVLLNINERNKLSLTMGESYKVRAYRAPWQIVNSDSDNIMIEPDFSFHVLTGEEVIDIQQTDGGNAEGNWAEITARQEGVAIVEVTYNAIDVSWSDKTESYGATNPRRTGVFIVTVGDGYGDIPGIDIDCEYYTHYFTGDSGILSIAPIGEEVMVEIANIWQGNLRNWKPIMGENNVFDIPIANGNHVLKITADGITDYRVIRGSKLEPVITNHTNPECISAVYPGDELTVGFKGLFQWIPKFSGIYNPSRLYAVYQNGDTAIESVKSQYALPETTMELTVPTDAENSLVLRGGKLTGNSLGSLWSAHRQLTDAGVPANFNASDLPLDDLPLPELSIPVMQSDDFRETDISEDIPDEEEPEDDMPDTEGEGIDVSNLEFDISEEDITGYVSLSFQDNGIRKSGETNITYETPLGEIIPRVLVPICAEDTVSSVTMRLLDAINIKASYTGRVSNNFYLAALKEFSLRGEYYPSFGEFDAGAASGWMVRQNQWFLNMGASEFPVKDGDRIEWLYTCQLGADIGCDWSNPSANITGIHFGSDSGTLSPDFSEDVTEYTYTVDSQVDAIRLSVEVENYWSTVSYHAEGREYRPMEEIPVSDGTVIVIESNYARYLEDEVLDSDSIQICICQNTEDRISEELPFEETKPTKEAVITENSNHQEALPIAKTAFSDVNEDNWYFDSVKYVYENNLMEGTKKGFEPDETMTRAMLVTVLYRLAKPEPLETNHSFSDVPKGEWYSDAVSWAATLGIVNGVSETSFLPNHPVTREQMALILYRFAKAQGYDIKDNIDISVYRDISDISSWAMAAMGWSTKAGLINGTSDTLLSPKKTATRAQVATIIMRFCEHLDK